MEQKLLSAEEGLALLAIYLLVLFVAVFISHRGKKTSDEFLVYKRELGTFKGALSIAAAWIWAPAVFVCSLKSYTHGLAGIFWFTVPNVLCFFTFTPLAIRLRKLCPQGYTWPDFVWFRYNGNKRVHVASLMVYLGYDLVAVASNCLAGGTLLNILTGADFRFAVILMAGGALTYSIISGLRASVLTDVVQMLVILVIGAIIVPWAINASGGLDTVLGGLGGVTGKFGSPFNAEVMYSFGIAATIGLISGPIGDQMFFQRAFSAKPEKVGSIFIYGGFIFALVPIALSALGFIAANPVIGSQLTITDPQMVGPTVVEHFLPKWALMAFCVMAFAGLCSTLDSALCAISSIWTVDVYKRYINLNPTDEQLTRSARTSMIAACFIGTSIALLRPEILWLFLVGGILASAALFPTIFGIFSKKLTANAAFWAIT
jgi:SSS family transporter